MAKEKQVKSLKAVLGSNRFFYFILGIFALQAGYIAARSTYSLPFDEGFHLGIIQLYAHQWSPFFSHLPPSAAQFGALASDPSWLYHYLMSFPYRFILLFTHSVPAVVVALRFLNIGLFVAGIVIYRKALGYLGASRALTNFVLLIFTLLPMQSFTAAQINYDNLLFLVTAAALLLTLRFGHKIIEQKQFDTGLLIGVIAACALGSQVKYSFLPIVLGIGVFLVYLMGRWWYSKPKKPLGQITGSFNRLGGPAKLALVSLLIVSSGLAVWRYGYNEARYGAIIPDCSNVLSVQACSTYAPWEAGYRLSHRPLPPASIHRIESFNKSWVRIMDQELFTIVRKGGSIVPPVRQFLDTGNIIAVGGLVLSLVFWRRLAAIGYPLGLFLIVGLAYLGVLWAKNGADFIHYGVPIATQGRYLLPVILPFMMIGAMAYAFALRSAPRLKLALALVVLVMCLQGGGVTTYMLRTDSSWYWAPGSSKIEFPN